MLCRLCNQVRRCVFTSQNNQHFRIAMPLRMARLVSCNTRLEFYFFVYCKFMSHKSPYEWKLNCILYGDCKYQSVPTASVKLRLNVVSSIVDTVALDVARYVVGESCTITVDETDCQDVLVVTTVLPANTEP